LSIAEVSTNEPFYVLLPDFAKARLALVIKDGVYSLPQFNCESNTPFHSIASVNEAVAKAWHIPVTVVRCLLAPQNKRSAIFALHNHDKNCQIPPEAIWIELGQINDLIFEIPEHRLCVLDWLLSLEDRGWLAIPWSSSSWFSQAKGWIVEQVKNIDATVIGDPIQIRSWAISCVLRVLTTAGTLYFKALPDFFGQEPSLTLFLSKLYPQHIPDIVAIEPTKHWVLMKEFHGSPPKSKNEWHKTLLSLSTMQIGCINKIHALLNLGCNDRRLELLPEQMQPVIEELRFPQMQQFYMVTEQEANELSSRLRSLPELCKKLGSCGIPETLIHGDLWSNNIIFHDMVSGKSPVVYDWSDGAISHPFFDIFNVITSEKDELVKLEQYQAHIDVWSDICPHREVVAAFELSQKLAPFYYLLSYRYILLNTPTKSRWELDALTTLRAVVI